MIQHNSKTKMSELYNFTSEERYCILRASDSYRGENKHTEMFKEHLVRRLQHLMINKHGIENYPLLDTHEVYLEYNGLKKYGPYASSADESYFNEYGEDLIELLDVEENEEVENQDGYTSEDFFLDYV